MPDEPEPLTADESMALDEAHKAVAEREALERMIDSAVDPQRQN